MDRYPTLTDCGGSGASRKPAAPAPGPTPSKDESAPAVVADTSRLASFFAGTSLEHHKPQGRPASSSAALVRHHPHNVAMRTSQEPNILVRRGSSIAETLLEQHKPWGRAPHQPPPGYSPATPVSHQLYNVAIHTSQGPNVGGGSSSGITAPDPPVPLQWGHRKRSRSRREAPVPTPAPEPELTPAEVRRRASLKFRNRKAVKAQARAEMPPPGAHGPNLSAAPLLPPHAGTLWLHGSAENPHTDHGEQQPNEEKQQLRQKPQRHAHGAETEKLMPSPATCGPNLRTTSPIPPCAATLSLHRCPRINPNSLPLADGDGGGVSRKPTAPTPSKDECALVIVADNSCLAPYFASTSLEHQMPQRRPMSSSAALVSHDLYNVDMHTSQGPNVAGGGGSCIARTVVPLSSSTRHGVSLRTRLNRRTHQLPP